MTLAHHSSSLPDGAYAGVRDGARRRAAGGKRVYFACDTSLFLDMKADRRPGDRAAAALDAAVLPIGDLFTMGPGDAVEATKLLAARRRSLPCHYNTFPPIEQDAAAWAEEVRRHTVAEPLVLQPGDTIEL